MLFLGLIWKLLNLLKKTNVYWILLWLLVAPGAGSEAGPVTVVNAFHDTLIQAMKNPVYEERVALVRPAINDHFQIHTIARISLGRNWQMLSDTQQSEFQAGLTELITTTYASRFKNYHDQVFTIVGSEDMKRQRKRVNSTLITRDETVSLDYQLQLKDDEWRIYDIVANGVSDLSLRRSSYAALFKNGGLDAVMAEISQNIISNQSVSTN